MAQVSTYFNFPGNTFEAFEFYKGVFGTEYSGPVVRMGDIPPQEGTPALSEESKALIMNIQLPIIGGHLLMGTDASPEMGFDLVKGNNVYISLHPDTREEADRLFSALSDGGAIEMAMEDQFWGDYFGSLVDKFGTHWMVNHGTLSQVTQ